MSPSLSTIAAACIILLAASTIATEESEQKKLLHAIHENPGVADHYVDLGNTLGAGEKIQLLPKTLTREEAYKLAIQIDPKNAVAFNNLGVTLPDLESTVTLADGTKMTKQELFLKAIESDPKFGHAYNNLGETMQPDQKVNYPDGRSLDRKDLFAKSIELDPEYPYAFNNLGVILAESSEDGSSSSVTIAGDVITARTAFLRCIALGDHPALHHCYKNLGAILGDDDLIQLLGSNGDRVNKEECIRRAKVLRQAAGISNDDEEEDSTF